MLPLSSSEAASAQPALMAVDKDILQLPLLQLPRGIEFPKNLEQMLKHWVRVEQGCDYFQQTNKKCLEFFLKNALKTLYSFNLT